MLGKLLAETTAAGSLDRQHVAWSHIHRTDRRQHFLITVNMSQQVLPHRAGRAPLHAVGRMLASTLGVPFDVDKAYDERREQYKMGGLIVRTTDVTQSAVGDKKGLWTTVVAVAVLQ